MRALLFATLGLCAACSAGNDKDGAVVPRDCSVIEGESGLGDVSLDTEPTDGACAASTYTATQLPASIMFVLDASDSMLTGGKWSSAAIAIVSAIDQDSFDSMSMGVK